MKENELTSAIAPRRLARDAVVFVAIAGLGLACVIFPILGDPVMPAPLFPVLRTAIEGLTWLPIAALAAIGLLAGVFTRLWPPLIALASIAPFPVATIAEMTADPTSHNLFPLEWMMYLMMAVPVLLTALAGRRARAHFARRPEIAAQAN